MANPIADAVVSGIAASMDPMTNMTRQVVASQLRNGDMDYRRQLRAELKELKKDLAEARDAGDQDMVDAYKEMVAITVKEMKSL